MKEPNGVDKPVIAKAKESHESELFTAVNAAKRDIIAQEAMKQSREATQTAIDAEIVEVQRLDEIKKSTERAESDKRATVAVGILQRHGIPTTTVYKSIHSIVGYSDFQIEKFEWIKQPIYSRSLSIHGRGWILKDFRPTYFIEHDDGLYREHINAQPGLILLDDYTTREFASYDKDEGITLFEDLSVTYTRERTWSERKPVEAPYANDVGLYRIGELLAKHGIASEEPNADTIEQV